MQNNQILAFIYFIGKVNKSVRADIAADNDAIWLFLDFNDAKPICDDRNQFVAQ